MSDLDKWKATIDQSKTDKTWDEYDSDITSIVDTYNKFLAGTTGYVALDWKLVKAMVWTESGGPSNQAWKGRAMQIGNPGDPGLGDLLAKDKGGELILPPTIKQTLTLSSAISTPQMNIRAGVGYLLMRFAKFSFHNVVQKGSVPFDVTVKPGDSLDKIARVNGSTVQTLKDLNPKVGVLQPKQVLKCQKASTEKYISGWDAFTTKLVAARYNVGDPNYAVKLDYCLSLIK